MLINVYLILLDFLWQIVFAFVDINFAQINCLACLGLNHEGISFQPVFKFILLFFSEVILMLFPFFFVFSLDLDLGVAIGSCSRPD